MVIMIHGRGADMNDLADLAPLLDVPSGCRFVFPNAPKPFEPLPGMSFGWTWFEGWPPEHESVAESRAELLRFLEEITALYPTSGIVISGFSQGAMMSLDVGLRMNPPPAGIIAMSGGLYEPELPSLTAFKDVPVLIAHGTADEVVPVHYARRARLVLEEAGMKVDYHEYPMEHQIAQQEIEVVKGFLSLVVGSR